MAIDESSQLFAQVANSADCSSSSCPPSGSSVESVPEGYLILTFDKAKRAKLKTAMFADVSDGHFTDEYDDENIGEDEIEDNLIWSTDTSLQSPPVPHPVTTLTIDRHQSLSIKRANGALSDQNLPTSVTEWTNQGDSIVTFSRTSTAISCSTKTPGITQPLLIRTSPITNRAGDELRSACDVPSSQPNFGRQGFIRPRINSLFPNSRAETDSAPQSRCISLFTRITNKPQTNFRSSTLSPWPRLRSGGFGKSRFLTSTSFISEESEVDSEKYPRKMLRCEACGKYYRNAYSLHHHICLKRKDVWKKGDVPSEVVDGQVVYFCPTCHKPFKWLGNLTRHFYVHTGQRFFKCDLCSKEFFSAYQVKRHMNSHTGRRFKCEVCDKPFTCKYACAWHTRQHYTNTH